MSDLITAIIREIRVQQAIFKGHEATADLLEITNRENNRKSVVLVDRIAELQAAIKGAERLCDVLDAKLERSRVENAILKATIERVGNEINQIDRAFNHPDTTSREAYRNIRAIVVCLKKALADKPEESE